MERLLVISPHCDDAVFSCGRLLAAHPGSAVVTAFAGRPSETQPLTDWDRASGFRPGDDVMGTRREEDRRALAMLDGQPIWLDFRDRQYGRSPSVDQVRDALCETALTVRPNVILFPLGLFHHDHQLVHRATLRLLRRHPLLSWLLYEEAMYRRIPGLVADACTRLEADGFALRPATENGSRHEALHETLKEKALRCYESQLRALATPGRPGHQDAFAEERIWRVMP